jgi:hypothetical protein
MKLQLTEEQKQLLERGSKVILADDTEYHFLPFWFKTKDGETEAISLERVEIDAPELYNSLSVSRETNPMNINDVFERVSIEQKGKKEAEEKELKRRQEAEEYKAMCLSKCYPFTKKYWFGGNADYRHIFMEVYKWDGNEESCKLFTGQSRMSVDTEALYIRSSFEKDDFTVITLPNAKDFDFKTIHSNRFMLEELSHD